MRNALTTSIMSRLTRGALDATLATARFQVEDGEHSEQFRRLGRPVVYVLWHGRLLPCTWLHREQGVATIISRSADGEIIARIVEQWGYVTVRGSSSRGGGAALRQLVRHVREGRCLGITPDGPRGPRQRMKPGALLAAQLTGAPLIPMAAGTRSAWWFEGWDRFLVPKPFANIRVAYGQPVFVPRDADEGTLRRIGEELECALNALILRVDGDAESSC
jgi:lysophospholipid acyltransferase (LPLAT)-like uncharacterized protein